MSKLHRFIQSGAIPRVLWREAILRPWRVDAALFIVADDERLAQAQKVKLAHGPQPTSGGAA